MAMTVVGPCKVLGCYDDGDYRVTFPEGCEPQEVSSIKPRDLWLTADYPDWQYNAKGERLGKVEKHEVPRRTPHMPKDEAGLAHEQVGNPALLTSRLKRVASLTSKLQ